MTTGDGGEEVREARDRRDGSGGRPERIGIGGGDDSVTRIQLAARWAEAYAPEPDSLGHVLKRFRAAYDYLDAVIHGVEPPELERGLTEATVEHPAIAGPSSVASEAGPPPPATPQPWS